MCVAYAPSIYDVERIMGKVVGPVKTPKDKLPVAAKAPVQTEPDFRGNVMEHR
jgi:hypothetical protein